jgi:predicted transcriptional regulator
MKERSLRDLFHLVRQVLPEEQQLVSVSSGTTVQEALSIMKVRGFSQLPVVEGTEVLGVFSYRSLSQGLSKLPPRIKDGKAANILALRVEDFLEKLRYAHVHDELATLLDEFDVSDAILVGTPERLLGMVSTIDALKYFHSVASPYVLLREIELAIRELIRASVDESNLRICCDLSLKAHYAGQNRATPAQLLDMSFNDYVLVLRHRETWLRFSDVFGQNQDMASAKLAPLPGLRNDVFHFRRELTAAEYDTLRDSRDWLLRRIRMVELKRAGSSSA